MLPVSLTLSEAKLNLTSGRTVDTLLLGVAFGELL
jgi:hypothetical protein